MEPDIELLAIRAQQHKFAFEHLPDRGTIVKLLGVHYVHVKTADGGDLMIREKSSASAKEHNITAQFTQGKGDASGPEPSYDGRKIIFELHLTADDGPSGKRQVYGVARDVS